jgi:nucleoside-diphosphate kinase
MAGNITFSIIKPDAVRNGHTGAILDQITKAGFKVRALKLVHLSNEVASQFYAVHKERGFFGELVSFMTSGPCLPFVIEKANAVEDYRKLIGATDPSKAEPGTIRANFAKSIDANAVHGSDSDENAQREAFFFFAETEMVG